jgi:hypothetical protein
MPGETPIVVSNAIVIDVAHIRAFLEDAMQPVSGHELG